MQDAERATITDRLTLDCVNWQPVDVKPPAEVVPATQRAEPVGEASKWAMTTDADLLIKLAQDIPQNQAGL